MAGVISVIKCSRSGFASQCWKIEVTYCRGGWIPIIEWLGIYYTFSLMHLPNWWVLFHLIIMRAVFSYCFGAKVFQSRLKSIYQISCFYFLLLKQSSVPSLEDWFMNILIACLGGGRWHLPYWKVLPGWVKCDYPSAGASGCSTEHPWHSHVKQHLKCTFADLGTSKRCIKFRTIAQMHVINNVNYFLRFIHVISFPVFENMSSINPSKVLSAACVHRIRLGVFGVLWPWIVSHICIGVREPVLSVNRLPPVVHIAATASWHRLLALVICPCSLYSHSLVFVHGLLFAQQCQCQLRP